MNGREWLTDLPELSAELHAYDQHDEHQRHPLASSISELDREAIALAQASIDRFNPSDPQTSRGDVGQFTYDTDQITATLELLGYFTGVSQPRGSIVTTS
jgi:hypothetical protein